MLNNKVTEAPEKIILSADRETGILYDEWVTKDLTDNIKIEYIRTDVFIDKVCEFLKSYRQEIYNGQGYIAGVINDETIEDFKNYIKRESVNEKKCMFTKDNYADEDRKVLCKDCDEKCEHSKKKEPVSEDLIQASIDFTKHFGKWHYAMQCFYAGAIWQKQKDQDAVEIAREEIYKWLEKNAHKYATIGIYTDAMIIDLKQVIKDK